MLKPVVLGSIVAVSVAATARAADRTADFVQERLVLPRMQLLDQHAERRDLTEELARDAILVINFSYTLCDSICPIGNDVMAEVDDLVEGPGGPPVRLLSITIDPTRDTPLLLSEAAATFDASENWVWLTGDPHDIDSLLESLGAQVSDIVLHDPMFLVGDAETGVFYRSLSMPTAEEIVGRIAALAR